MNKYYPKIENQEEILKELCKQKLNETYGNANKDLESRLNYELDIINKTSTTAIFILLNRVFTNLNVKPYQFGPRGLIGGSLVAYLCDFSNIDPIKYELSQYVVFGIESNYKEPDININLNIENGIRNKIINELESYDEIYKLVPAMVKDPNGHLRCHPGSLFIVPKIEKYEDKEYELLIDKLKTTDCHDITEFYELDLLGHNSIKLLEELINNANNNLSDIETDNSDIINYLATENYEEIFDNIPEFQHEFSIKVANVTKPKTFNDLVKILSVTHGTDVWNNNAELLINDKKATLQEVISNRDDIFDILVNHNVSIEESYKIMENVRKGKGYIYNEEYKELFKKFNLPEWFGDSCSKIKYLFPRAHAISYTLLAWQLIWFKIHYKKDYDKVISKYYEK